MILRPYQDKAISDLWDWFSRHKTGHPIMNCCVGAGKSLMIAATIQKAISEYPNTRVLMVAHQKELLQQNLEKLLRVWPEADVGIYSAALNRKELGHQITYATIGSVYKKAHILGKIDLIMGDEVHLIQTKETGIWRTLISDLNKYHKVRVVGWTGTPFRNGGIWLTEGDFPIFTGIATTVSINDLLELGYLSPLVNAKTFTRIDTSNVRTVGGDYAIHDLAEASNRSDVVKKCCTEMVNLGADRQKWLVFCVTVQHAENVCNELISLGIKSEIITGKTSNADREKHLSDFKHGKIRALVSVGVLTTGFDQPDIDFIALLRATKSPTLYVQLLGRGMRLADGKTNCSVADFTNTIETLGPVDLIRGRRKSRSLNLGAPYALCDNCGNQVTPANSLVCPDCGEILREEASTLNHTSVASNAPILSAHRVTEINTYTVTEVKYRLHKKANSPDSLRVDYWAGVKKVASDWICLGHQGYAKQKAVIWWRRWLPEYASTIPDYVDESIIAFVTEQANKPDEITVNESWRYPQIVSLTNKKPCCEVDHA